MHEFPETRGKWSGIYSWRHLHTVKPLMEDSYKQQAPTDHVSASLHSPGEASAEKMKLFPGPSLHISNTSEGKQKKKKKKTPEKQQKPTNNQPTHTSL